MERVSVLAITKNGLNIALKLKSKFPYWKIYVPSKFSNNENSVEWYSEPTAKKVADLFKTSEALICLFSLGAVIRLIAPYIKDKKTDPAVIVIDDKTTFVISALSGHLGGANKLTLEIANELSSTPVVTTAADVNKTIPVDLLGSEFGWKIDNDSTVTKVSAYMVNEEKIGVYQEAGEKNWWSYEMPKNVTIYPTLKELEDSGSAGFLIISDKKLDLDILADAVIYRPKSLVVGVGLHWDTSKDKIKESLETCFEKFGLSLKSIAKFATIKKKQEVSGLNELSQELKVPIEFFEKEDLAKIPIPNPSETVKTFEGTPSVSEAAAIKSSGGRLIVEKQKFPPDLTIAVARKLN